MTNDRSHGSSTRWDDVFSRIPSHHQAASTGYYRECEELLFRTYVGSVRGKRVFKTDLWDEVRNTQILQWVGQQGGRVYGIDIAPSLVQEVHHVFCRQGVAPGFVVGDVRRIPFGDNTFDVVYSMGTIEHFPEVQEAIDEIFRVLRPGGTAIIGVPNKLDPFLRPLMVTVLNWFSLYPYGYEKSFMAGELAAMARKAGFQVQTVTGLLFIPGVLRIADLWLHVRRSPLAGLTALMVRPFSLLYERIGAVRRHGYLIACIARKPAEAS